MPTTADTPLLFAAFAPYLGVALYDGWLHEKARRVPKWEQALHATVFCAVATLWWGILTQRTTVACAAMIAFAIAAAIDEFGYHAPLARHERRIHAIAYLCFAGFAAVAWRQGALG